MTETAPRYPAEGNSIAANAGAGGNATLNTLQGQSAFAAGAATCVITNSKVRAGALVLCSLNFRDATGVDLICVATANTLTFSVAAAATAKTAFSWQVLS
jgi:hypothetical protein